MRALDVYISGCGLPVSTMHATSKYCYYFVRVLINYVGTIYDVGTLLFSLSTWYPSSKTVDKRVKWSINLVVGAAIVTLCWSNICVIVAVRRVVLHNLY